jgi:Spy/CpxP family protein refolding chaperone
MKRIVLTFAAAGALAVLAAAPLAAGERHGMGGEGGFAAHRLSRCLDTLNLSTTQRADIDAAIAAAKPALQADRQALMADRQKLKADLDAGADKAVIGQDTINMKNDREKMRTDASALRDQIASKLSADQQNQLKGCFRGPRGGNRSNPAS